MLLKMAGSLMLLWAATSVGFGSARSLENQVLELERLEVALESLSSGVSYALEPLPRAMMKAGERAGGETGRLFCLMGAESGLAGRRTPHEAFTSVVAEGLGPQVSRAVRDILADLFRTLGASGHKEQVRHIDMSIDRVRSYRKSVEDECRKKARVYRYLGVLAGLSAVIALV